MNNKLIRTMRSTESANKFIYYVRKIPLIGKHINPYLYLNQSFKNTMRVVTALFNGIKFLFKNALPLVIILNLIPFLLDIMFDGLSYEVTQPLILFTYVGFRVLQFYYSPISKIDKPIKWQLIKSFKRSYEDVYWYEFYRKLIGIVISALMLLFATSNYYYKHMSILAALISILLFFIFEAYSLYTMRKYNKPRTLWNSLLIPFVIVVIVTLLSFSNIAKDPLILISLIPLSLLALYSFNFIRKFPDIELVGSIATASINLSNDAVNKNIELMTEQFRVKEEHIEYDKAKTIGESHTGYSYLNRLFLLRHQNLWLKPLRLKVLGLAFLGVVMTVLLVFFDSSAQPIPREIIDNVGPVIFVFYFFSAGESLCKAYFLNCDYSLLHYPFYTRRETILQQFTTRLITIILLNLAVLLVYVAFLILWVLLGLTQFNLMALVPYVGTLILVSLFFSLHHLFLYYILQPFDRDLKVSSVPYHFASFALYFFAFNIDDMIGGFTNPNLLISMGVIVYIIAALVLVWLFSEKTFKVKA